jgi:uncharacterized membrane protein
MASTKFELSSTDKELIQFAIQEAEKKTTGEIRVHIQRNCNEDPVVHAGKIFQRLGMQKTEERNGVLFYLAVNSHAFALVGDIGIHEKVGQDFWNLVRDEVISNFKKEKFTEGLIAGIKKCGMELNRYFPADGKANPNELSNEISVE